MLLANNYTFKIFPTLLGKYSYPCSIQQQVAYQKMTSVGVQTMFVHQEPKSVSQTRTWLTTVAMPVGIRMVETLITVLTHVVLHTFMYFLFYSLFDYMVAYN